MKVVFAFLSLAFYTRKSERTRKAGKTVEFFCIVFRKLACLLEFSLFFFAFLVPFAFGVYKSKQNVHFSTNKFTMSLMLFDPLFDSFAWPELQRMEREMGAVDVNKEGDFKYVCNFQGFRPSDIKVHHEGDHVIVEAERKHHGRHEHFERSLKRMIKLPDDVDKQNVRCEFNEKGEITIHAHKLAIENEPQKRTIPITFKKSQSSKI